MDYVSLWQYVLACICACGVRVCMFAHTLQTGLSFCLQYFNRALVRRRSLQRSINYLPTVQSSRLIAECMVPIEAPKGHMVTKLVAVHSESDHHASLVPCGITC